MKNNFPKYRAWHKKEKYMTEAVQVGNIRIFSGTVVITGNYVNIRTKHGVEDLQKGGNGEYFEYCQPSEVELLMYSGLNDINGKEIYQNDIVYIAGYGHYVAKFPFIELYEASFENDIGAIIGNIYEYEGEI